MPHRFLPHTADTIVEIEGLSVHAVFQEATTVARLLFAGDTPVRCKEGRNISLDATGHAELLYCYLRELVVWFQIDAFLPASLETVELSETQLVGVVHGEPYVRHLHEPQPEVKAVTRHQLSFDQTKSGWRAVVVLDV